VRFVDMQPKERLPEVLAAGDIHVVPLKRGLAWSSVPSKLYSILAAGRPVVASVDAGTEVARTIDQAGAGLSVPPEDAEAFTKAIRRLLDDPDEARAMGERGRAFVEGWASPAAVAEAYERLFLEVIGRR
jgi:colanic acid biosynthesis glycosyl transferase WcaI